MLRAQWSTTASENGMKWPGQLSPTARRQRPDSPPQRRIGCDPFDPAARRWARKPRISPRFQNPPAESRAVGPSSPSAKLLQLWHCFAAQPLGVWRSTPRGLQLVTSSCASCCGLCGLISCRPAAAGGQNQSAGPGRPWRFHGGKAGALSWASATSTWRRGQHGGQMARAVGAALADRGASGKEGYGHTWATPSDQPPTAPAPNPLA